MELNEYQDKAKTTARFPDEFGIVYCTLALNGESGEVAEKVKKVIRDANGEFTPEVKEAIAYELGDVFWYLANLADQIGYTLQEIGDMNLIKLASRKKRGKIHGSGDNR